jgi:protein arginine kinase activator
MLCCICNEREAKVHLTQIITDKMEKLDLCEDCVRQKGVSDTVGFSLADVLLGLRPVQGSSVPPRSDIR